MSSLPLIVAQLNDGIESQYPTTDVPRLSLYAQVICGQELDRQLSSQLPDWWTVQGTGDNADLGMAIKDGLMSVEDVRWERMATWKATGGRSALVVRANYSGCLLSLMTTHRPTASKSDLWPEFDANLSDVVKAERDAGRVIILCMDANQPEPQSLQDSTRLTWNSGFTGCIDGILTSGKVSVLATTILPKTGEHYPTLALVKVPT